MTGHLTLRCGLDDRGESCLVEQSFCAPFHLSKPHRDAGVLVVNIVNPTAGVFAGDTALVAVTVETGAQLVLTSPGALRVHHMTEGSAHFEQTYRVAAGGFLEVLPELFIPQARARYAQTTALHAAEGSVVLFWESLAPGRVASGEQFAFTSLDWTTEAWLGPRKILRERYRLTPDDASLTALRIHFPSAYYASCLVIAPEFTVPEIIDHEGALAGVTRLGADGAWLFKILAAESPGMRAMQRELRAAIYRGLSRPLPSLRRT